jgi:hypothetical protein
MSVYANQTFDILETLVETILLSSPALTQETTNRNAVHHPDPLPARLLNTRQIARKRLQPEVVLVAQASVIIPMILTHHHTKPTTTEPQGNSSSIP